MNAFQAIPPKVRTALYLGLALVGLFLGACEVIDVTTLWGFPVDKALQLLAYVSTAFGFTAAANVTATRSVVDVGTAEVVVLEAADDDEPGDPPYDEQGHALPGPSLWLALAVLLLVAVCAVQQLRTAAYALGALVGAGG